MGGADPRERWTSCTRWGLSGSDGKPRNVVIDSNDDAWLIGLGGGCTDGWVDKELVDTVEGDEQGGQKNLGVSWMLRQRSIRGQGTLATTCDLTVNTSGVLPKFRLILSKPD